MNTFNATNVEGGQGNTVHGDYHFDRRSYTYVEQLSVGSQGPACVKNKGGCGGALEKTTYIWQKNSLDLKPANNLGRWAQPPLSAADRGVAPPKPPVGAPPIRARDGSDIARLILIPPSIIAGAAMIGLVVTCLMALFGAANSTQNGVFIAAVVIGVILGVGWAFVDVSEARGDFRRETHRFNESWDRYRRNIAEFERDRVDAERDRRLWMDSWMCTSCGKGWYINAGLRV